MEHSLFSRISQPRAFWCSHCCASCSEWTQEITSRPQVNTLGNSRETVGSAAIKQKGGARSKKTREWTKRLKWKDSQDSERFRGKARERKRYRKGKGLYFSISAFLPLWTFFYNVCVTIFSAFLLIYNILQTRIFLLW